MTQISVISGILASKGAEFRTSYPINLEPVFVDTKISKGQLRTTAGTVPIATGSGKDRGGVLWNNVLYRASGDRLIKVMPNGNVSIVGYIGGDGYVAFDYSFDRVAIASDEKLFYYDGTALAQVTDEDLGTVIDMIWVDGYFMCTDGKYVVVTELSDPTSIMPLKYGSADDDPDAITGLIRVPGGLDTHVCGRYTIQAFQNVGGNGFPFSTVRGATIPVGCVGPGAKALFGKTFAFVGSPKNQPLGVHVAGQGEADKISTKEVDDALAAVADSSAIRVEARAGNDDLRLLVHLPAETWVFLASGSQKAQQPIWYRCMSGEGEYRLRNAVEAYGKTIVGDTRSAAIGSVDTTIATHFGEIAQWQFDVGLIYTAAPVVIHAVELVGLPGRGEGTAFLSFTRDGETFSLERSLQMGPIGGRQRRIQWRPHVRSTNYIGMRFRGYGTGPVGFAACEVG